MLLANGGKMDSVSIPSVLIACGREGDLMKGKEVHGYVCKNSEFDVDAPVGNALIDMYGKCGCLNDSEKVFRTMPHMNVVTWTTMISCYGMHGNGEEVRKHSCSSPGYLVEALELLKSMKSLGTGNIWGAFLAGCVMHKDVKIAKITAHHLFQLEPNNTSHYIALCGIYQSHGMLDRIATVRERMRDLDLVKTRSCS
ncbi:pentatricopeptide repeat-containing protein At3g57430, chloroplastic-like [Arachis duranensis]|uniref:Pentatricopeptide repeat-containing protein At3g57430, chloroplastic-like n=1 Tax=Arachis duranensis TaxID=130453 RepID=A0A9C6WTW3_ARADU|nr:pentatricopeptide repeat-containing protein At3g57430, chloroplastic-like [Arachis duranensis]